MAKIDADYLGFGTCLKCAFALSGASEIYSFLFVPLDLVCCPVLGWGISSTDIRPILKIKRSDDDRQKNNSIWR